VAIDFSQEELRLLARIAGVKKMIDAYAKDVDLHTSTTAHLYELSIDDLQRKVDAEDKEAKEMRRRGKTLNFAVGYGSTEWGLYKNFDIPIEEGKVLLNKFYTDLYPEIEACKQLVGKKIQQLGYSMTLFGRKRFFEIKNFFPGGYKEAEKYKASVLREGFNHIIQGTGAEIIKKALCRIYYENPFGDKLKILLQVYDEIVCEAADDVAEDAKVFIETIMLECEREYLNEIVPAKVDGKIRPYWAH